MSEELEVGGADPADGAGVEELMRVARASPESEGELADVGGDESGQEQEPELDPDMLAAAQGLVNEKGAQESESKPAPSESIEEYKAKLRESERARSRSAGEAGYWKRKALEGGRGESDPRDVASETGRVLDESYHAAKRPDRDRDGISPEQYKAIQDEVWARYEGMHPEVIPRLPQIRRFLGEHPEYQQEIEYEVMTGDPNRVRPAVLRGILEADRWAEGRAALEQKRADSRPGLQEAKRKATISGSGAAPSPPPRAKSLDQMSVSELSKELDRLTRK